MFKKYVAIMVAVLMLIAGATACAKTPSSDTSTEESTTVTDTSTAEVTEAHTHTATGAWTVDAASHWKLCDDCGEKTDEGTHILNDDGMCTVCGSEIYEFDESKMLYVYDDNGNPVKMAEYASDGTLVSEILYEYEYDANGCMLKARETTDGKLTAEYEYVVVDGESMDSKFTGYMEDGSKYTNEYDTNGHVTRLVHYNADGSIAIQMDSEYTQIGEDGWYENKRTEIYGDGTKIIVEYNQQEDATSRLSYDAEGNLESTDAWEYTYDDNGNKTSEKIYTNDVLTSEILYKTAETDEWVITYPETVTEYGEDGGKTVTVYDENGAVVSETQYDADGTVIE